MGPHRKDDGGESPAESSSGEDVICLEESFFVNRDYELTTFRFGEHALQLYCLQSASTDFDLTGQLVWPGAVLMNNYLSENAGMLQGHSVIELGSGVGITGILCCKFCKEVVLTDHNEEVIEILNRNIMHQESLVHPLSPGLYAEKLDWGNIQQIDQILQKHPDGFDLILGADICFQQSSVPLLFTTVEKLLSSKRSRCRFILAYVSRAKVMDTIVTNEAVKHGMRVKEISGTRTVISNLVGVIYEITLN